MSSTYELQHRHPGRWMVLFACIMAVLMAAIDAGILNLIVPAIQQEFDPSQATIGLMTSISTLMLAAFILGGGPGRYGRNASNSAVPGSDTCDRSSVIRSR